MRRIDCRNSLTGCIISICFVATCANRVLVFHCYGSQISFSLDILFWIWITFIPDLLVLFILYTLLVLIGWKYPHCSQNSTIIGLVLAVFILLVSACNIMMLTITGRNMEWKIVFEVDLIATKSLYLPHISSFLSLLLSYFLLGTTLWFVLNRYIQTSNELQNNFFKTLKIFALIVPPMYFLLILVYRLPQAYRNLSSNMVLTYFPEIMVYYWRMLVFISFHMEDSVLNNVAEKIRAPAVNISQPLITLKKPIKHVFLIVLESIRADALPLNESLAKVTRSTFLPNVTAADVTPFLTSLWMNSVRTTISASSSYTLKSLLSIYCGIYPLNVNFLKEIKEENSLYDKCLPELIQETFRTKNNQSAFRSGFFTAARGDFDHQKELFTKFKFDTINDGFDISEQVGSFPDLGMFGPADTHILPLLWKWIDDNLTDDEPSQLMTSLLVTGTHEPFPIPFDQAYTEYRYYTHDERINPYLNAMRKSDDFVKEIIDGFKTRQLYNETLFVIVSDHGYVFNDYGSESLGLLSTPLESAFSVPLIFYNPYLEARQFHGQFTSLDILPTIMDILLSSLNSTTQTSMNRLTSVPKHQLESILSRYEGTSILRMPLEQQPIRYTFSLSNPGNSYIIVKQYPRKLTYDVANDEVHLYHLAYDPTGAIDLIALHSDATTTTYPSWIKVESSEDFMHIWKGRWISKTININSYSQIVFQNRTNFTTLQPIVFNNSIIQLSEMLNWADQTFELTRLWTKLIEKRYRSGSKLIDT